MNRAPEWNRKRAHVALWAVLLAGAGCADSLPSAARYSDDELRRALTPALAQSLGARGQFDLISAVEAEYPQIDAHRGRELARAYIRSFGTLNTRKYRSEHGRRVVAEDLEPCRATLFARSSYELGATELPAPILRMLAGHYLTQFCDETGTPQVLVAVSAAATGLGVLADGRLSFAPGVGGHSVYSTGIPRSAGWMPMSAEDAAIVAAGATSRRVSAIPELIMPSGTHSPAFARWRIVLDEPLQVVRRDGEAPDDVSEVYVGFLDQAHGPAGTLISDEKSPSGESIKLTTPDFPDSPQRTYVIYSRAGTPATLFPLGTLR